MNLPHQELKKNVDGLFEAKTTGEENYIPNKTICVKNVARHVK